MQRIHDLITEAGWLHHEATTPLSIEALITEKLSDRTRRIALLGRILINIDAQIGTKFVKDIEWV